MKKHLLLNTIFLIFSIAYFFLVSCSASIPELEAQLNNPSKRLTIRVESVPPGATIYGLQNGETGSKLGTTPMNFMYTQHWKGTTYGTAINETVDYKNENRVFSQRKFFAFKCLVFKAGYKLYKIYQVFEDSNPILGTENIKVLSSGTHKTFTAFLEPLQTFSQQRPVQQRPHTELPSPAPMQQQQQQQTVVIPDFRARKEEDKGTVIISSSPENADVYIDGIFVGNTPCKLALTDGIHIIEIKLVNYRDYKRELRVIAGSQVTIKAKLK